MVSFNQVFEQSPITQSADTASEWQGPSNGDNCMPSNRLMPCIWASINFLTLNELPPTAYSNYILLIDNSVHLISRRGLDKSRATKAGIKVAWRERGGMKLREEVAEETSPDLCLPLPIQAVLIQNRVFFLKPHFPRKALWNEDPFYAAMFKEWSQLLTSKRSCKRLKRKLAQVWVLHGLVVFFLSLVT